MIIFMALAKNSTLQSRHQLQNQTLKTNSKSKVIKKQIQNHRFNSLAHQIEQDSWLK
ncbi:unnamed protein product, partial [Rotaria socialis]